MGKINAPGIKRNWTLKCDDFAGCRERVSSLAADIGYSEIFTQIVINRGFDTKDAASDFLEKRTESFYDPFIMADMDKAVERIAEAVKKKEKIVIYGDYDVDGVTSVSVLKLYLDSVGADASYFIPSRFSDGYGLARGTIDNLINDGVQLIITVDTGITACDEVAYASSRGVDVIVTDHHECREVLPAAVAVVNPHRNDCNYPFKELAGVGVIFKLVCALECYFNSDKKPIDSIRRICYEYCDLVSIGTVADVMPIIDENRLIVSLGLGILNQKQRTGIEALVTAANSGDGSDGRTSKINKNKKITSGYIGFTLAPRINAAGRISDATVAVELLLENNPVKAHSLARELCDINRRRQEEENKITEEASQKIAVECDTENDRVIVLSDENWHQGIIGIVASRISEKYGKPTILISFEGGDNSIGKGSGRSVGDINLVDALSNSQDLLLKYGGHALAAGLTIDKSTLENFKKCINHYVENTYPDGSGIPSLVAELEVEPQDMTMDLAKELYALEPHGVSNPAPLFMMRNMSVYDILPIGSNRHTKLTLGRDDISFPALCFGTTARELDIMRGDCVDIVFSIDINEYQNVKTLQLIVRDIALSDADRTIYEKHSSLYRSIMQDGKALSADDIIPTREEFAAAYTALRRDRYEGVDTCGFRTLSMNSGVGMIKLRFIMDIFSEMGLVDYYPENDEIFKYGLRDSSVKVDLTRSKILNELKKKLSS